MEKSVDDQKIKIIVTLGPSTRTEQDLWRLKDKGVDFVRVNMSHSGLEELKYFLGMAKKVGIPFILDTEGSQVRTGELSTPTMELQENDELLIYAHNVIGNTEGLNLKPASVVPQLEVGDLIFIDFNAVTLRISDTSSLEKGYIQAKVITGGTLGKNKAVVIDTVSQKKIILPTLSEKDYQSIQLGLQEGTGHIAASFMRSGSAVDEVRQATQNTMKVISKIECVDALEHLDEIIKKSDYLLIDRGDLSKEIPIEKIPFTQKIIIERAKRYGVPVWVATNLLETMVEKNKPTRAEVHDVINTVVDGAQGLALAAETAIGKHPLACINMLNNLINHAQFALQNKTFHNNQLVEKLEQANYLFNFAISSSLIQPHGGKLVDRMTKQQPDSKYFHFLPQVLLDENRQRDVEQIAIGTYSPVEGFMGKEDTESVLDRMRLANGLVWPLPIILDVSEDKARELTIGKDVALVNDGQEVMAILHLEETFTLDKKEMARKLYATDSPDHPGVQMVMHMEPVFLSGKITLLQRLKTEHKQYELTPRQARKLFEERGWSKVVGFHTRNVIHRSHEFIQLRALELSHADGLFVHPIVGKKKTGDFQAKYIIQSYEKMIGEFYPKNRVIFGTFSSYSRYAGPREALFTALCRQNFGCSHFIVGRDHTGVGNFYHPNASHTIFDRFPELDIKAIHFDNVFYSQPMNQHVQEGDYPDHAPEGRLLLSGTEARKTFERGEVPPDWFMRPEIAQIIVDAIKNGEEVFVRGN